jgi:hypothetical protein
MEQDAGGCGRSPGDARVPTGGAPKGNKLTSSLDKWPIGVEPADASVLHLCVCLWVWDGADGSGGARCWRGHCMA